MTKPNEKLKTYNATKVNEYFHIETYEDDPNVYGRKFKFVEKAAFDELMKDAREMREALVISNQKLNKAGIRCVNSENSLKAFDEKWNPEPRGERK